MQTRSTLNRITVDLNEYFKVNKVYVKMNLNIVHSCVSSNDSIYFKEVRQSFNLKLLLILKQVKEMNFLKLMNA